MFKDENIMDVMDCREKRVIESIIGDVCIHSADICGIGTSRVVYRVKDKVIKFNIHELGHKQSLWEKFIYSVVDDKYKEFLAEPLFVSSMCSIWDYRVPLCEGLDGGSIDCRSDLEEIYTESHDELMKILSGYGVSIDDLEQSMNCSVNKDGKLMYIDYGFKEEWFDILNSMIDSGEICIAEGNIDDNRSQYHKKVTDSVRKYI